MGVLMVSIGMGLLARVEMELVRLVVIVQLLTVFHEDLGDI
jgi:hypothetical protein